MSKTRSAILIPVTAMLLFWALTPISIAYKMHIKANE
jgi:hypothetical protein